MPDSLRNALVSARDRLLPSPDEVTLGDVRARRDARSRRRRVTAIVLSTLVAATTTAFLVRAFADPEPQRVGAPVEQLSAGLGSTETMGPHDACPVTIPPQPGFVPPEPYPSQAPALYQQVWYGTAALWTMLGPDGEVWEDLPHDEGTFVQNTLWWSQGYSPIDEPIPPIAVSGRQLDGPGAFEAGSPGTNGFRSDIGGFMLVGVDIPTTGCWELTARYGDAELTYVVLVKR